MVELVDYHEQRGSEFLRVCRRPGLDLLAEPCRERLQWRQVGDRPFLEAVTGMNQSARQGLDLVVQRILGGHGLGFGSCSGVGSRC